MPVTTLTESGPPRMVSSELVGDRLQSVARENVRVVWRFLRRIGLSEADADDATQEVLLVLTKKLDVIRIGSERAFALSTAFRIASTMRRLERQRQEVGPEALDNLTDPKPRPDRALEQARALEILDGILAHMSLEFRAVFVAAEFEGLSLSEIAEAFGIPRGTAASRLRAAREDFRARVARYEAKSRHPRGGQ